MTQPLPKEQPESSVLTLRDLARRVTVYPALGNRFRVILGSGRVTWATARWQNGEPVVECVNVVAKLAVEIHERARAARSQGL
jgi:hypothetical protein